MKYLVFALLASVNAEFTCSDPSADEIADCDNKGCSRTDAASVDCESCLCDCSEPDSGCQSQTCDESDLAADADCVKCRCSEESAETSECSDASGCLSGTSGCSGWSKGTDENTSDCPGTCECSTEESCPTDPSDCLSGTSGCSGWSKGTSENTSDCPGTCECSSGSGSGSAGSGSGGAGGAGVDVDFSFSYDASYIATMKATAIAALGPACTATGPECAVDGQVCYGATITNTDTAHVAYSAELDSVVSEIAEYRYCMNEQLCMAAQTSAINDNTSPYTITVICGAAKIVASLSALLIASYAM